MHTFHIPVMGISFSIDTPLKVAHYGINSVISIMEDTLLEQVRKVYSEKEGILFDPVLKSDKDFKANRVLKFLNLMKELADKKFQEFKQNCTYEQALEYFNLLPDDAKIKKEIGQVNKNRHEEVVQIIRKKAEPGSIDVNIMTKVDKVNYEGGKAMGRIYNDAHASLRGFAKSNLKSSLVLSAGLNPSLYSYIAGFDDFFPDKNGEVKKKIILKVSDFRSALIQSKFLAKKGIWVSEFRVESGLNCGGHAFATEGLLMGPILEEFKNSRIELICSMRDLYQTALDDLNLPLPKEFPAVRITAQGGIGTAAEHRFLIDQYELDAVGWGSPFLLVPEVTCLDEKSRKLLCGASENELYLSNISPLGVPFNNLLNNSMDLEKAERIKQGRPGSPCVKKYLTFNTEFTDKPICTASRTYQSKKIKELNKLGLKGKQYKEALEKIIEKACICTGLGTSFLINNGLSTKKVGEGVSLCPGPNMAYFNKIVSLKKMVGHIYGRENLIERNDRPHVFIKELKLYRDYFQNQMKESIFTVNDRASRRLDKFRLQLLDGIAYYKELFQTKMGMDRQQLIPILNQLTEAENQLLRSEKNLNPV